MIRPTVLAALTVTIALPSLAGGQATPIPVTIVTEFGGSSDDPTRELTRVSGVIRTADGRFVVAIARPLEVRVIDAQGRQLATIGRAGDALLSPAAFAALERVDVLVDRVPRLREVQGERLGEDRDVGDLELAGDLGEPRLSDGAQRLGVQLGEDHLHPVAVEPGDHRLEGDQAGGVEGGDVLEVDDGGVDARVDHGQRRQGLLGGAGCLYEQWPESPGRGHAGQGLHYPGHQPGVAVGAGPRSR